MFINYGWYARCEKRKRNYGSAFIRASASHAPKREIRQLAVFFSRCRAISLSSRAIIYYSRNCFGYLASETRSGAERRVGGCDGRGRHCERDSERFRTGGRVHVHVRRRGRFQQATVEGFVCDLRNGSEATRSGRPDSRRPSRQELDGKLATKTLMPGRKQFIIRRS